MPSGDARRTSRARVGDRRRGRGFPGMNAFVAAFAFAASVARAAPCFNNYGRCGSGVCTLSTLMEGPSSTVCELHVGNTLTGQVEMGTLTTSFSLAGSGVTQWNGSFRHYVSQTPLKLQSVDFSGLQYMNGTILITRSDFTDNPAVVSASFPDLVYADRIDVSSTNALSFPKLISVAMTTPYTSGTGGAYPSAEPLQVHTPAGFSFPVLQEVNGNAPGSRTYPATTPNAFPALTTIIGNIGGSGSSMSMYPALKNVTGNVVFSDTSLNWLPELELVGGDMEMFLEDTVVNASNFPLKLTNITGKLTFRSENFIKDLTIPSIQSVGKMELWLQKMLPGSTVNMPDLTTITSVPAPSWCEFYFREVNNVTTIRMESLDYIESSCSFLAGATSDATGKLPQKVSVHVPCKPALDAIIFQKSPSYDWQVDCPTGCNLCTPSSNTGGGGGGGGGGDPSLPSAVPVTTASLSAAVSACLAESAAGSCQCSGASCGVLSGPISQWSFTGTNLDMGSLFEGRTTFNQPVGSWDVSGATSMKKMFKNASSFNQPIGGWVTSSVIDMTEMFAGATAFARDISGWDVDQVATYTDMFDGADAFNAKYSCTGPKCSGDPKLGLTDAQIAGVAVGCIAFVIVLIIVVCIRRRRRNREQLRERLGLSPASASPQQPQIIVIQQQ